METDHFLSYKKSLKLGDFSAEGTEMNRGIRLSEC